MKWIVVLAAVCLTVCAACAEQAASTAAPVRRVVAVSAFANLNKDPAQDWLSTGIGETLTVKLAKVPSLTLVERMRLAEAMKELRFNDTAVVDPSTAVKLGKMVGAQAVVVGAIQRAGDKLRITARFVDSETSAVSNAAQVDGDMDHVFDVQDKLAAALLETLGVQTTPEIDEQVKANPTRDVGAYEAYSKGVSSMQAGKYDDAEKHLRQATEKDPSFSLAQRTLQFVSWARPNARSAVFLAQVGVPFDRAYDAMIRAVKAAPNTILHSEDRAKGLIAAKWKGNWINAGQDIDIELKPLEQTTGIRITSQTKRSYFGIRQKIDWGESRKSIDRILKPFYEELQIVPAVGSDKPAEGGL